MPQTVQFLINSNLTLLRLFFNNSVNLWKTWNQWWRISRYFLINIYQLNRTILYKDRSQFLNSNSNTTNHNLQLFKTTTYTNLMCNNTFLHQTIINTLLPHYINHPPTITIIIYRNLRWVIRNLLHQNFP